MNENPNVGLIQRAARAGLLPAEQSRRETWAHDTGYKHGLDGVKFKWLYSDPTGCLQQRFEAGFALGQRMLRIQGKMIDTPTTGDAQ